MKRQRGSFTKKCLICGRGKLADRYSYCPGCRTKLRGKHRKEHLAHYQEQAFEEKLWKNFGMSLDEYEQLSETQNECCAICQRPGPLCVDHDHATGEVRGLLCHPCNKGLGLFQDHPSIVYNACRYLMKRT